MKKIGFYRNKKLLSKIDETDINKIFVSKRETCDRKKSFKYFIGYDDNDDIKPLYMNKIL